jgi:hypothetical protein
LASAAGSETAQVIAPAMSQLFCTLVLLRLD